MRGWPLLVVAAALAPSCKDGNAVDRVERDLAAEGGGDAAPAPSKEGVVLSVVPEKTEVALGDDIVFRVKLTNDGSEKATVNLPRLDRRSVSFRVRRADGSVATVTRIHADLSMRGEFVYEPQETKELAPGESLDATIPTVAVEAGKLTFTGTYVRQGAPAIASEPVEVTVTPADAAKPRLGVKIDTTHGALTVGFRPDVAYNTVESFASLVKRDYFTGVKFHRIVKGFMAQGGDPQGTGEGGPGYMIPLEATNKLRHVRGIMSMARTPVPDSAGSQFFLMFTKYPSLDPVPGKPGGEGYTIFGEMVEGEETLKKLENVPCGPGADGNISAPKELVAIKTATLVGVK